MSSQTDHGAALIDTIRNGRAVIVAGTGVSIAASINRATGRPHSHASWAGLLENGLQWLKEHKLIDDDVADAQLKLLKKNPHTHRFISLAEDVTEGMGSAGSPHFAKWLKRTVGSIQANDRSVLDALHAVRIKGHLLATTNYDGLLLDHDVSLSPLTWLEADEIINVVRNNDTNRIIFLHGYWLYPKSVVLDWKSYDRIARDEKYREDLNAFWRPKIWVYVGCGMAGLNDPDFGLLLERYGKRARQSGHWDYCLVKNDQKDEFQAYFDQNGFNIRAIPFGQDYSDLPNYLRSLLPESDTPAAAKSVDEQVPAVSEPDSIPTPPAFYAEPNYIGSHTFVGRTSQLQDISEWAMSADPANLLLFDAIGGNGKSMLTWEWITRYATGVRSDWAGRFWYSFYEHGAVMADFCRRALSYMTGRPIDEFEKKKTAELASALLARLHARPWLINLDGLERVLVAYHRIDAAEVPDEEANAPTDKVLNRNPCDTIRDEDGDLLRALVGAKPSKILVSSRLTPRVLLNPAGQPIPGIKRIELPGLRPADAEQLLRSCGITGDSSRIQEYLTQNCDNHPLVIGVLAGLIANYMPDRGNFDVWLTDTGPQGGAKLDLGSLNLIQRRNHILRTALDALDQESRQLLSTLALISESVDYETLSALNPHLPPEPEEVKESTPPEKQWSWDILSEEQKNEAKKEYKAVLAHRKDYEVALKAWCESAEYREAPEKLAETVRDLEQRGLLQYDGQKRRYDLHPVVRSVTGADMKPEDKQRYGQRVVDHFSSLPHNPYEQAKTLEDVAPGLHVVRTLLKLGRFKQAAKIYKSDFSNALIFNLEAYVEILSLLKPFFPSDWSEFPKEVGSYNGRALCNSAGGALYCCGELKDSLAAHSSSLMINLENKFWEHLIVDLANISENLNRQNLISKSLQINHWALAIASLINDKSCDFACRLILFYYQFRVGQYTEAEETWQLLDAMDRPTSRSLYCPGEAECFYAAHQFYKGTLQEEHLSVAKRLTKEGQNRFWVRRIHALRGRWRLEQRHWGLAADAFHEAVRMARERGLQDEVSEAGLALAKFNLGQFGTPDEARQEAKRLAGQRDPNHLYLAMFWRAIGDYEQARKHALAAYKWAWADGEPYVHRWELNKTTELLGKMDIPVPNLPPYDPDKDEPFPWEADVRAAIEKLKAEKKAWEQQEKQNPDESRDE